MTTKPTISQDTESAINRLTSSFENAQTQIKSFLTAMPLSAPCPNHHQIECLRDDSKSWSEKRAQFQLCEICRASERDEQSRLRLQRMGVPSSLCHATFDNWTPRDEQEHASLAKVQEFCIVKRGFLVMLGNFGTGKTHLAAAAIRKFNSALFVKQSELLRRLRATYRDKAAVDPIDEARNARCLVIDEMGLSPGGRDEFPMLHDILDYRHGNQMPTILTGNLSWEELCAIVAPRMGDRFQESVFAVLSFGGESHRGQARDRYFDK